LISIRRPLNERLDGIIRSSVDHKTIFGTVLRAETGDRRLQWTGAAGDITSDSPFFIASTTKLYITASLLKLRESKKIELSDKIGRYIDDETLDGLHRYQGTDYSRDITIAQLMAHTSGLPDYFQHVREGGSSLMKDIVAGRDQAWSFEKAIADAKRMQPHFPPGKPGKAHYSDTNYQLLGRIVETVANESLEEAFRQLIYEPLALTETYLYPNRSDQPPRPLNYKKSPLHVPQAMASFGPDGGIVSTAEELMRFLRGFFEGKLFPKDYISELSVWNRIFFPLQYGVGIAKFQLPRAFTLFRPMPALIGHSGLSGAFAFYCPDKDVYLTGTVNQIDRPGTSYRLMLGVLNAIEGA